MTNNNNRAMDSHDKREDLLRRAETSRRTSFLVPNNDASAGPQDATTVWDIRTVPQLKHWVAKEPSAVMVALIELRQERDAAMACIEGWESMRADLDQAQDAAEEAQTQRQTAQEKYRSYREKNSQLQTEAGRLNERIAILEADIIRRQSTPSSTISGSKQRTSKTSDPPLFCQPDGDITLDDWTQRIWDKLTVNRDHFEDDRAKTIYVISRTGGIAAEQIYSYQAEDPDYFATPDEVLSMLQDVMGNPNKRSDMRRGFKALKMSSKLDPT